MKLELAHGRWLDLAQPCVMGVLNVTPDSFSDGGRHVDLDTAVSAALAMLDAGAAIIDIGGESTRPGATRVAETEEIDRVVPVIERLCRERSCILSIDTMKPAVMRAACKAGALIINDVNALRAEGAVEAALETGAAVCLMHMQGEPQTMQTAPVYVSVVDEVLKFLEQRVQASVEAGIPRSHLLVDPGFGFGKTLAHNLELLAQLPAFRALGLPVLVGMSRKGMLGQLTGRTVDERIPAGLAAAALAVAGGAKIIRTHDVGSTVDAAKVAAAVAATIGRVIMPG